MQKNKNNNKKIQRCRSAKIDNLKVTFLTNIFIKSFITISLEYSRMMNLEIQS